MHIQIELPRPGLTLLLIAGIAWVITDITYFHSQPKVQADVVQMQGQSTEPDQDHDHAYAADLIDPQGGDDTDSAVKLKRAEEDLRRGRIEQALLNHKEEILRYQLKQLEEERRSLGSEIDSDLEEEFREATRTLSGLLQDEHIAEQFMLASLNQIREAQGRAQSIGRGLAASKEDIRLGWPVDSSRGISAPFHDAAYEERFGFVHEGTDIRALQGTTVRAAADGIVKEVTDNGLGFNSITIEHDGGFVTLYGHVTTFLVEEGDRGKRGDDIALSGGRPGSPGAGFSTGPHLHFELYLNGVAIDAEAYLPRMFTSDTEAN